MEKEAQTFLLFLPLMTGNPLYCDGRWHCLSNTVYCGGREALAQLAQVLSIEAGVAGGWGRCW
jgi:hypothetical protein